VNAAVDAALAAGVTSAGNVQYALLDRRAASEEALAAALKDAANQARVIATASRMKVAGVKQIQVGPSPAGPVTSAAGPSAVDVRASVTVTYFLKS
jgi:uncharacterized protein YggE